MLEKAKDESIEPYQQSQLRHNCKNGSRANTLVAVEEKLKASLSEPPAPIGPSIERLLCFESTGSKISCNPRVRPPSIIEGAEVINVIADGTCTY